MRSAVLRAGLYLKVGIARMSALRSRRRPREIRHRATVRNRTERYECRASLRNQSIVRIGFAQRGDLDARVEPGTEATADKPSAGCPSGCGMAAHRAASKARPAIPRRVRLRIGRPTRPRLFSDDGHRVAAIRDGQRRVGRDRGGRQRRHCRDRLVHGRRIDAEPGGRPERGAGRTVCAAICSRKNLSVAGKCSISCSAIRRR